MAEFLYIHIPYCVKKCIYCDFLSLPFDELIARKYVDSLCRELEIRKAAAGTLKTIFIGGGTPTLLPEDCFRQLFHCLRENFDFSPEIEISVEANPGTVSAPKIGNLLTLGVNRMSIGIQSFNDNELKTLGRIHNSDEALEAVRLMRTSGLMNLSVDLMYGIPGQTIGTWQETLEKAAGLTPQHISSYELTPEKDTPLSLLISKKALTMPEEGLILDMYSLAIDFLRENKYDHYEISNFAFPGFRCRHNLNYWDRGKYIGAGAGAHSFIQGIRSRNTDDINTYIDSLTNDVIPVAEATEISADEAIKEFIFLGLRKTEGVDLPQAKTMMPDIMDACSGLVEHEYLAITDNRLKLTRKGLPLSNMVIVQLFERLGL
ncbi:MAG: radical SAM family heme chaperone HemW [Nitrospiraceae bacterium]|jgi:oxygen-independent coproporphyrinogen III oxidase|nr:MAG: radical SAM family heme chaperone HemW [Nitrospiraceae bacterium]